MHRRSAYSGIASACGALTACMGGISLLFWLMGRYSLTGILPAYIPIAPNSAFSLLLLGGALFINNSRVSSGFRNGFSTFAALTVSVVCSLTLIQFAVHGDWGIDRLLFSTSEMRGGIPVGRMSPLSAALFLVAAFALWFPSDGSGRVRAGEAASAPEVIVAFTGLIILTGYLYGTPLLYGGVIVPVSILAAAGFVVLGAGIMAGAGPKVWPLSRFAGPSIYARMMRAFLPFIIAVLFVEDWSHDFVFWNLRGNPALVLAFDAILSIAVVSVIVSRIARFIDRDVERNAAERRTAEMELKESHERFIAVLDGLDALVYAADFETHEILFLNRYGRNVFGNIAGEVCWRTLQAGQTGPCEFCTNDRLLTPEGESAGVYAWEFRNTVNDRWYEIRDRAIRWVGGRMVRLEIAVDITERKRMEEALQRERDRAQGYLDIAGGMIVVVDADQRVSLINKRGCEILGYCEDEIIGKDWIDEFLPEAVRYKAKKSCTQMMRGELEPPECYQNTVLAKGGGERSIAWYSTLLKDEAGKIIGVLSSGEDVTESKKLESQLRHSQKMEAIGRLAGGVAHDFNNILTAIMGYTYMLQMKMNGDDPLQTYVEEILNSSASAASVTQSLLAFSRKQIINTKPVDVNEIVGRTGKLLLNLINEDVELRVLPADEDLVVMADNGQIQQILMNLVTNARDAMPDGGKMTISTSRASLDAEFIKTHGYGLPGQYALLCVSDSGAGMDEKIRERIFEPFFTTKEVGKGTGLGLSIVFGIVKQHNGYISAHSEPNRGTTFKIYLPLISFEMKDGETKTPVPPAGGKETILLAEDDGAVRKATREGLERAGYSVIEAVDGEDAIDKFMRNGDAVRLLVLDVIMPKKNGKEVYEAVKKIRPDIKTLFTSGYTADIIHRKGVLEENLNFISKPASPCDLLRAVRRALDQ